MQYQHGYLFALIQANWGGELISFRQPGVVLHSNREHFEIFGIR